LTAAGEEAVLTVTTNVSAKLGLIYMDVKNAAKELKSIFSM